MKRYFRRYLDERSYVSHACTAVHCRYARDQLRYAPLPRGRRSYTDAMEALSDLLSVPSFCVCVQRLALWCFLYEGLFIAVVCLISSIPWLC